MPRYIDKYILSIDSSSEFALFVAEYDYCQARYHFIRSEDGEGCAEMLIEYHIRCGYPSEVDMFVAQAVFQ